MTLLQPTITRNAMINNFDIDDFLQHHWQQKPLLIRNAFVNFSNPLTPEELAGLACEEDVESRIVAKKNGHYELAHGPFEESVFTSLPDTDWTLLVQAVDHYDRDVADLLNQFRFIPNWRIDDVMVSYASKNGGIPAHTDNYDVFLLQGAGCRQWQLGSKTTHVSQLQSNEELQLLDDFEPEQEWLLNPGDMLYVPPGFGHRGTSMDNDCMTYSIGFRAPSHGELLSDFCDHQISLLNEQQRYSDPQLKHQQHPGQITPATLDKVQDILKKLVDDKDAIAHWFGEFMTLSKYPREVSRLELSDNDIRSMLNEHNVLYRDNSSRFAYTNTNKQTTLHINAQSYNASLELAALLANNDQYSTAAIQALLADRESFTLIQQLIQQGELYFEEQHNDDVYG
ncbi:cupin domain-containing protein [Oceanicoccus sagamiensis]|uniref:JmjC domain-containing protein n=1 Tax=Oceanicoccus sagamiensis TaxID=716816 RepID=A0A1X9NFH8_9GAMM|nr:cupin domain-containing protein [Oceanicoccus sagamiensis]ARN75794.1 hypothetical protein BST96_17780 [Oceanicoccus sagamiensis]